MKALRTACHINLQPIEKLLDYTNIFVTSLEVETELQRFVVS